jgi:hypothetical protein
MHAIAITATTAMASRTVVHVVMLLHCIYHPLKYLAMTITFFAIAGITKKYHRRPRYLAGRLNSKRQNEDSVD